MKEYLVTYERGTKNCAAFSPDVPPCIATGKTRREVERNFSEALAFHLEGLKAEGLSLPQLQAEAGRVSVAV